MMSTNMKTPAYFAALLAVIISASWIISIRLMNGMDMGVATKLGSFISFIVMWIVMMAAMMLPGISPAILRFAHVKNRIRDVLIFIGSYLIVWVIFGVVVYLLYKPHGFVAAGITLVAAGIYEFIPLKKHFRVCCYMKINSGFKFGLYCVGSTIGLMLVQIELGIMSITWMLVIAIIITVQKLFPKKSAFDIPLALVIICFGIMVILVPSLIPGLIPAM